MDNQQLGQLGSDLATKLGWDGVQILQVAMEALTQANFHAEAEVLEQMVKFLEQTDETPVYRLEIKDK